MCAAATDCTEGEVVLSSRADRSQQCWPPQVRSQIDGFGMATLARSPLPNQRIVNQGLGTAQICTIIKFFKTTRMSHLNIR